jgi:hypothetical protein
MGECGRIRDFSVLEVRFRMVSFTTMNVERTVQFILENQARSEVRIEKMEKRFNQKFDAVMKLLHQGMKNIASIADSQKRLTESHRELAASQKRLAEAQAKTERTLKAFLDTQGRQGQNGNR